MGGHGYTCNSCTMDIKGVLDLYYNYTEGSCMYSPREYIQLHEVVQTIHTQMSMVQVACTMNTY